MTSISTPHTSTPAVDHSRSLDGNIVGMLRKNEGVTLRSRIVCRRRLCAKHGPLRKTQGHASAQKDRLRLMNARRHLDHAAASL